MKGDYANSRIYRIVCNVTGKQYFGSTTQSLAKRLSIHKNKFKQWQKGKLKYIITSFEVLEGGNYDIVLVEELPDIKNVEQLRARERYHIEANECVNKVIPTRTMKEYREDHKEETRAYGAKYRAEHKDERAKYRAEHKEEMAKYREDHKEETRAYRVKYRAEHKKELNAYTRKYHADHKEELVAKKAAKVICEHCGSEVRRSDMARHQRTKKCLAAQAQN